MNAYFRNWTSFKFPPFRFVYPTEFSCVFIFGSFAIVKLVIVRNLYVGNVWKPVPNEPCLCFKHSKDASVLMVVKDLLCFISCWVLCPYRVFWFRFYTLTGVIEMQHFLCCDPLEMNSIEQTVWMFCFYRTPWCNIKFAILYYMRNW